MGILYKADVGTSGTLITPLYLQHSVICQHQLLRYLPHGGTYTCQKDASGQQGTSGSLIQPLLTQQPLIARRKQYECIAKKKATTTWTTSSTGKPSVPILSPTFNDPSLWRCSKGQSARSLMCLCFPRSGHSHGGK